jgi:diaminopimelate decarboxylase
LSPALDPAPPWWLGDALAAGPRGLALDGAPLADVARDHGTPVYAYGARTVRRRLGEIRDALRGTGAPFRVLYAIKACRFDPVLQVIRREGDVGIDASSPGEVACALAAGFAPDEISVTASMLSDRDLQRFVDQGVHLNLDTRSALRRWAAIPGRSRRVGLRVDPRVRVGWGDRPEFTYGDSKFGFDPGAALDAAAHATSLGLEVDQLHVHAGWGLQANAAPALAVAFARLAELSRAIPTVRVLNVGGGLGARYRPADQPLALEAWAALLREHLAPTGCTIACEQGTFVMATAGVLVAEVNTVEERRSGTWVGVDAGHNVNCFPALYGIPLTIAKVAEPLAPPTTTVHVAGNINEANDVFARAVHLPPLAEGDLVALYPTGAYGASMASEHCLRGLPAEVLV